MFKKIILFIMLSSIFLMVSCSNQSANVNAISDTNQSINVNEIIKNSYEYDNIKIDYPQIQGNKEKEKEQRLNKLIKDNILRILDYYDVDNINNLTIEYEISYKNSKILSIKYFGLGSLIGSSYPNNIFYTTNLNIVDESIIQLNDIIDVNETLISQFKNEEFKPSENGEEPLRKAQAEFIKNLSNEEISRIVKKGTFYLNPNTLGISIEVIHAIGDHAEYEIEYEKIKDNNSWNEFSQTFLE